MLKNKTSSDSLKRGFTIVEMLIIAPIVILTIGAFVTVIVNMTGDVLATRSSNVLAYSIQDALNRIEDDVKFSTTFLEANNVTLPAGSQQGFNNDTTNFANVDNISSNNGNMLILNTLATTGNPLSPTSGLIYLTGQPNACGATQNKNTPMTMNIIYFVKNGTLWRRTIMPSNYAAGLTVACSTPWQQPSCLPGLFPITDPACKTQDVRLVDGISDPSNFVVQYFNTADATAANTVASDTNATLANRHIALQSTQTASATINITKTAAGRQVSQSGTMRVTRLDINSSTIADVVVATTPATPTVTASFSIPNTANFTWPAVPGTTSYTVNYNIAGGTYVNGSTGSAATSFSMTAANNQSVCVTVYAVNSAGTSAASGPTCMILPLWNSLLMSNNWTDYSDSFASAAYTKTSAGIIVLKGLVKRAGTLVPGEVIATLPPGYRPAEGFMYAGSSVDASARIDVNTDGTIRISTGSTGWASLDGISFIPATSSYTWTALPLLNGWVWYGGGWATPAYTRDSEGRVFTKGLIANGGTGMNAAFTTLPAGYRPSEYLHMPTTSNNLSDLVSVDTSGNLQTKSIAQNAYRSMQHRFYAASGYNGTWNNLTLLGGWITYAGYATPQYIKANDGVVTVKGLIYGGTAGTIVAQLPLGYRPSKIILLNGTCNLAYCRFDVYPDGTIHAQAGASSSWSALEAVTFMADGQ